MKKILIIGLITGILIIGLVEFYFLNFELEEEIDEESQQKIFCPNYDGNQQECLLHNECEWDSNENNCDLLESMEEGDVEDGNDEDEHEREGFNEELEAIKIPDNPSNVICKKIPLSNQPPYAYGSRYQCLAMINNDARFCEGIDEKKEQNMCLAYANEDSSYCKEVEGQDAKHTCYFILAVSSENVEFCKEINYLETAQENQEEKLKCYYNFISNLYQWDKSNEIKTEYCNEFPSSYEDRNTCFALKARDISMCGDNPNCLTHFEQPLSFCDEVSDRVSCIKDRAKTNKDVSLCELLSQPDRDICVGVYCTHTELDVNICAKIEDINKRQEMYIELAMNLANW